MVGLLYSTDEEPEGSEAEQMRVFGVPDVGRGSLERLYDKGRNNVVGPIMF